MAANGKWPNHKNNFSAFTLLKAEKFCLTWLESEKDNKNAMHKKCVVYGNIHSS